jgi:hypothetical protein
MPMYAFVAPIRPNKTEDFRRFVSELNGSRKTEYEDSRKKAGITRENIFLQKTSMGEMVAIIQEAETEQGALDSLRSMKDPFNVWYFQRLKDIHGADLVSAPLPVNELLLDYRTDSARSGAKTTYKP